MAEHIAADELFAREDVTSAEARERFVAEDQPYKVELIDDLGADERLPLHQRPLHRPLPRPARAVDQAHQGLQAAVHRRRLLARRLRQHDAHPHLRDRLPLQEGPRGAPRAPGAGPRARPPQARPAARPVHLLRGRARLGVLAAQGHAGLQHARRPLARDDARARLRRGQDPAALRRSAVGDLRPLGQVPREHVHHGVRGPADGPQAHELPGPRAPVQPAALLLPRPARPLLRARPAAPPRAVRHAARPAARPPLHPGRRPHLLHGGAGRGRGHRLPGLRLRLVPAVRLRDQGRAVHPAREPARHRRVLGQDRGHARGRAGEGRAPVPDQRGRRRLLRAQDRPARDRLARPLVAARHRPARLQPARALRASPTRAPTTPSTGR